MNVCLLPITWVGDGIIAWKSQFLSFLGPNFSQNIARVLVLEMDTYLSKEIEVMQGWILEISYKLTIWKSSRNLKEQTQARLEFLMWKRKNDAKEKKDPSQKKKAKRGCRK